jgi:hypothetical protein
MNMNAITKHYDKLTTRERFGLLVAAGARGDDTDRAALLASAPRKTWSIPTTNGFAEAFTFLSMFHIMTMQENSTLYNLLLDMDEDIKKINMGGHTWIGLLALLQARTLSRDEAWRVVCAEYGINPEDLTSDLPGAESVLFFVEVMKRSNDINPVNVDPTEYINDLHAVIEKNRAEWE